MKSAKDDISTEFLENRTTKNLILLLEKIASGDVERVPDTNKLVEVGERSVIYTHENLLQFDEGVWTALQDFDLAVDWDEVPEYVEYVEFIDDGLINATGDIVGNDSQPGLYSSFFNEMYALESEDEGSLVRHHLPFFEKINKKLEQHQEKALNPVVESSRDLSEVLMSLLVGKSTVLDQIGIGDKKLFWRWFLPSVAQAYRSMLRAEFTEEKSDVYLLMCLGRTLSSISLLMYLARLAGVRSDSVRSCLVSVAEQNFPNNAQEKSELFQPNVEIIKSLAGRSAFLAAPSNLVPLDIFVNSIRGTIGSGLLICNPVSHQVVIIATCKNRIYDMGGSDNLLLLDPLITEHAVSSGWSLIEESVLDHSALEELRNQDESCFTYKTMAYMVNNYWGFHSACSEWWEIFDLVARDMTTMSNEVSSHLGHPVQLSIFDHEADLLRSSFSTSFYSSVSLMGINFANAVYVTSGECLDAAKALVKAGYRGHGVTVIAYHMYDQLVMRGAGGGVISFSSIDNFLSSHNLWEEAKRYLLPVLAICDLSDSTSKPLAIWIKSVLSQYNLKPKIIPFDHSNLEKTPAWINHDNEQLIKYYHSLRKTVVNATQRGDSSDDEWRSSLSRSDLPSHIGYLVVAFETKLKKDLGELIDGRFSLGALALKVRDLLQLVPSADAREARKAKAARDTLSEEDKNRFFALRNLRNKVQHSVEEDDWPTFEEGQMLLRFMRDGYRSVEAFRDRIKFSDQK